MTATWEGLKLDGRPGNWYTAAVGSVVLDVYREGRGWRACVAVDDEERAHRDCATLADAKSAAAALALEVLDEMRRAVEGLRS